VHALFFKIFCVVMGVVCLMAGIISIKDREAKLSWGEDGYRLVEGLPAVLFGLMEIAMGIYIIVLPYGA
jgi:hypothetical protein